MNKSITKNVIAFLVVIITRESLSAEYHQLANLKKDIEHGDF